MKYPVLTEHSTAHWVRGIDGLGAHSPRNLPVCFPMNTNRMPSANCFDAVRTSAVSTVIRSLTDNITAAAYSE